MSALSRILLVAVFFASSVAPAIAQEGSEPLLDDLRARFQTPALRFGAVFQLVADLQGDRTFPGENGLGLANMRLSLSGQLDGGFGYFFQSNFGNILDARMSLALSPALAFDGGLFKAPLSAEFLIPAQSIDFVNRSQVVSALVPGREMGLQARGQLAEGVFSYWAGIFNAGGNLRGNSDGRFHYVGRLRLTPSIPTLDEIGGLEIGLNAALNDGEAMPVGAGEPRSFEQMDNLIGLDARLTGGPWLFSGEALWGAGRTAADGDPWGVQLTSGYLLRPNSQILLRWDYLDPDLPGESERNLFIVGWNLWPTGATELQVNGIFPTSGFGEKPQLLVNAQVSF